jgi:hypothetical protein
MDGHDKKTGFERAKPPEAARRDGAAGRAGMEKL